MNRLDVSILGAIADPPDNKPVNFKSLMQRLPMLDRAVLQDSIARLVAEGCVDIFPDGTLASVGDVS